MPRPDATCLGFLNLLRILEKSSTWAKTGYLYEEVTRSNSGSPSSWVIQVSGIIRVGWMLFNRLMVTQIWQPPLSACQKEEGSTKMTWLLPVPPSRRQLSLQPSSWSQTTQCLTICPWHLSCCHFRVGAQSELVSQCISTCEGPLIGAPGTAATLHFTQPLSLGFHGQKLWKLLLPVWNLC